MLRASFALVCLTATATTAAPCESFTGRDLGPLTTAAARDRILAETLGSTATTCAERGPACDAARAECQALLTSVIKQQVGFDEGVWLRDMLLPFMGKTYPMSRTFPAARLATDASCNVDVGALRAAAGRRAAQAARRDGLREEYQRFAGWAEEQARACRDRLTEAEVKSAATRAESERLAAAAAAAQGAQLAEEARRRDEAALNARKAEEEKLAARKAEADARQRDEELRRRTEADRARAEQDRRTLQEQLDADARRREELEARATAQRQAEQETLEAKQRKEQELKLVTERRTTLEKTRTERAQLLADAELLYRRAVEDEAKKRRLALEAVNLTPSVAQAAVAEAGRAEQVRIEAERKLHDARIKAERMELDDSFERSRGHVGLLGGGGALAWFGDGAQALLGGSVGALASAHLGLWQEAPPSGMASGFELALWVRFAYAVGSAPAPTELAGQATARYFFGPVGVGVAGEFRVVDLQFGTRPFGLGPTVGVAIVDTPHLRAILGVHWLPLGTAIDLTRISGEMEFSWEWFTVRLVGGSAQQELPAAMVSAGFPVGWSFSAFVGGRFRW